MNRVEAQISFVQKAVDEAQACIDDGAAKGEQREKMIAAIAHSKADIVLLQEQVDFFNIMGLTEKEVDQVIETYNELKDLSAEEVYAVAKKIFPHE